MHSAVQVYKTGYFSPGHRGHHGWPEVPHVPGDALHTAAVESYSTWGSNFLNHQDNFWPLPTSSQHSDHLTAALQCVAHRQIGEHDVTGVGCQVWRK